MPTIAAAIGLVLALGAGLFIAFWPCSYRGVESTATIQSPETAGSSSSPPAAQSKTTCKSFFEMNGAGTLWILGAPATISALGLLASLFRVVPIAYLFAVLLLLFSVLTGFSIGLLFFPATAALFIAAATSSKKPAE